MSIELHLQLGSGYAYGTCTPDIPDENILEVKNSNIEDYYTEEERKNVNRSYRNAIRRLDPLNWKIMLLSERIAVLQAIENKNAMEQERIPCEVVSKEMEEDTLGCQQNNQIVINRDSLLDADTDYREHINTIFHEGSHAREAQAKENMPIPNSQENPDGYWNHPSEIAAREAGARGLARVLNDRHDIIERDCNAFFRELFN